MDHFDIEKKDTNAEGEREITITVHILYSSQ